MRTSNKLAVPVFCLFLAFSSLYGEDAKPTYTQRWVYASHNLQVEKNADELIALIQRMKRSGYNGLVLADYKLNILDRVPDHYFGHVARVQRAARAAGIEIIPTVCPFGYSEGILAHDPNLAEGVPVKEVPVIVRKGQAVLVPDPNAKVANGDLERARGNQFANFYQDDPGKSSFADTTVVHGGKVSCRMQDMGKHNPAGNCRLIQRVAVQPFRCYRLSCWVKTRNLQRPGAFQVLAIGTDKDTRSLSHFKSTLKSSQDWKKVEVVFNSLSNTSVHLYAGVWGGGTGTLWVDDLQVEEVFLVNVLRREGCPLVVTSRKPPLAPRDGKLVYQEGKDFEPVRDAKLGKVRYAGEYSFDHSGAVLRVTESGGRIKEGQKLLVSYYHPLIIYNFQVACCLKDPKVFAVVRDQIRRVEKLFRPRTYFMAHDEIRLANWCKTCQTPRQSAGKVLAENVKQCVQIINKVNPRAKIIVWSDMFDPNHNAVDRYYLVNGSLKGSWKGLPKNVQIANWNAGKAAKSLRWFADRGHPQIIAGYYDQGVENFHTWNKAARGVTGVQGFLYTTWEKKYDHLEAYGRLLRENR